LSDKNQLSNPKIKTATEIEHTSFSLLNEQQLEEVVVRVVQVITEENFSGPIAHPKHMREYEEILPGSAERIFSMAEAAQRHNQEADRSFLNASLKVSLHGMYLGFAALVLLIFGAIYVGMNGNNILAGFLLAAGLLSGAAKLIHGGRKNNDESQDK